MDGKWHGNVHDELDLTIRSDDKDSFWDSVSIDDDDDDVDDPTDEDYTGASSSRNKRKRGASKHSKRHSRDQIQQLEAAFLECPHPDENMRLALAEKLGLGVHQVKFWFQNRRSAKKNQLDKENNKMLREENEALQAEHEAVNAALLKKICPTCGGPMVPRKVSPEIQRLLLENTKLQQEIIHVREVVKDTFRKAKMPMPGSYSQLAADLDINGSTSSPSVMDPAVPPPPHHARMHPMGQGCVRDSCTRASVLPTALLWRLLDARDEFRTMVKKDDIMWLPTLDGDVLDYPRYHRTTFPGILGQCPPGFGANGTRDTGLVMGTGPELVNILTDVTRFCEAFPGLVGSVTSNNILPASANHGEVQLMNVNLTVLSPRMPICNAMFARQCVLIDTNTWAMVDVSVNDMYGQGSTSGASTGINGGVPMACRMLPSGCLIQDMKNGHCKVTWIVNVELDSTVVPGPYLPLLRSGHALGARRWLTSLQRHCQYLAILRLNLTRYIGKTPCAKPPKAKNSVLELAQKMTARFCATLCGADPGGQPWSSVEEWRGKCAGGIGGAESFEVAVRVATLRTAANNAQGLQAGLVVSAATTVWLPGIPANHVYVYLCDGNRRADWDTFSNGAPVQQEDYFAAIQFPPHYAVSVLRPKAADCATHKKMMLQQLCGDESCKLLAYAPVDEQALKQVMRGGSHAAVSLLPSGFVVLPDGRADEQIHPVDNKRPSGSANTRYRNNDGCIVSVLFQRFLGGPPPPENITKYIIDQLGTLVSHSVVKIKEAVHARVVVTVTA
ncbi:hypothetical protein ACQ4PT_015531 [Festuca glaucescens]